MNVSLTLEQIIQQELDVVLAEQRGATFKQSPTKKFNAKRIAQQLYDAKGTFSDNEELAIQAIRQIKNIEQYRQVLTALKKLTEDRGIAAYLKSFLSPSDLVQIAIHLYDVLPSSSYDWTVKKLVSYDDLKTAVSALSGRGSRYDNLRYGNLPGRAINQIQKMFNDSAMYKDIAQQDDTQQRMKTGVDASDILLKPFVSTEYYLKHNTWSSFINAPGGLRDMAYSPAGVGITTAASLIPNPWTRVPVAILFGILAVDDITKIIDGDDVWFDLLFDSIGIAAGAGIGKLLKPIAQRFSSFIQWIKGGGTLIKISQKMFAKLFQIVEVFSKTKLGTWLSGGPNAINALQQTIRSGISKALSTVRNILTKLKNSAPDPIKNWAINALNALKSTSAEYYIQEIKPMFDGLRIIAKVLQEYIRAPKTAVLDLARKLGIESEWVVPVATGAQAMGIAYLFQSIPDTLSWWQNWYQTEMNKQQREQWIRDIESLTDQYEYYAFKNKPGKKIMLYSYNKGMDPLWDTIGSKTIKTDSNSNGPVLFIVNEIRDGYAKITIPSVMSGVNEINQAWVKLSQIQRIKTK